jgi:hypothetical protein
LHYFSMVAFETFRAALVLVGSVSHWCYPFRRNRCRRLEKALVPFVLLVEVPGRGGSFELRIIQRAAPPEPQRRVRAPVNLPQCPLSLSYAVEK